MKYRERTAKPLTQQHAKSVSGVGGRAVEQTDTARSSERVILLLEDELWLAEIYATCLRTQNYIVHLANNAQAAINTLDEHPEIELALVDLLLPGHNGLTFIYEALSQIDWRGRRFVLMSSLPLDNVVDSPRVLDYLKVVDYIYKPAMKPQELADRIALSLV